MGRALILIRNTQQTCLCYLLPVEMIFVELLSEVEETEVLGGHFSSNVALLFHSPNSPYQMFPVDYSYSSTKRSVNNYGGTRIAKVTFSAFCGCSNIGFRNTRQTLDKVPITLSTTLRARQRQ